MWRGRGYARDNAATRLPGRRLQIHGDPFVEGGWGCVGDKGRRRCHLHRTILPRLRGDGRVGSSVGEGAEREWGGGRGGRALACAVRRIAEIRSFLREARAGEKGRRGFGAGGRTGGAERAREDGEARRGTSGGGGGRGAAPRRNRWRRRRHREGQMVAAPTATAPGGLSSDNPAAAASPPVVAGGSGGCRGSHASKVAACRERNPTAGPGGRASQRALPKGRAARLEGCDRRFGGVGAAWAFHGRGRGAAGPAVPGRCPRARPGRKGGANVPPPAPCGVIRLAGCGAGDWRGGATGGARARRWISADAVRRAWRRGAAGQRTGRRLLGGRAASPGRTPVRRGGLAGRAGDGHGCCRGRGGVRGGRGGVHGGRR